MFTGEKFEARGGRTDEIELSTGDSSTGERRRNNMRHVEEKLFQKFHVENRNFL